MPRSKEVSFTLKFLKKIVRMNYICHAHQVSLYIIQHHFKR